MLSFLLFTFLQKLDQSLEVSHTIITPNGQSRNTSF